MKEPRFGKGKFERLALWLLGLPLALLGILYLLLLITPIPLPFVSTPARAAVEAALPPSIDLELGGMGLALEGGWRPVLQFSPVAYTDRKTGGRVEMAALEVGVSPLQAMVGQPGVTITMVRPHIQMIQDLFGPRLGNFDVIRDPASGETTVRVQQGEDAFPSVDIRPEGIAVKGALPDGQDTKLRSDNDWLIYNLEGAETSLSDVVLQSEQGRFSRLVIRDGILDMNDAVYGLYRQFTDISLDITPGNSNRPTSGEFTATVGGRQMQGSIERVVEADGKPRLKMAVINLDFASFLPFIDDPDSMVALRGAGAVSIDVGFSGVGGKVEGGKFDVDMTGTDLRIEDDYFPIASSIIGVTWEPRTGQFTMDESELRVGQSSGVMSGVFRLGLDEVYGPTVAMAMSGRDIAVHPNDMAAPEQPFESMTFSGWSAPLYGALGIDQALVSKGDARIATKGRIDVLRSGIGMDLQVAGEGVTADDLKRLWPYMMSQESRDWFVKNVTDGVVESSNMEFKFPIGAMPKPGEDKPMPPGALKIDIVGTGVVLQAMDNLEPIAIEGRTRLQLRDAKFTVAADAGAVNTSAGPLNISNAALVIDSTVPNGRVFEISGDVEGGIPALIALGKQQRPDDFAKADLPIKLDALEGKFDLGLLATIQLGEADAMTAFNYVLNGSVSDFASTEPIQSRKIGNGQLLFSASQDSYQLGGTAEIDGIEANVEVTGTPTTQPQMLLSAEIEASDLASMGFDASEFLSGKVKFVARPMPDGEIQMAVDLEDAGLNIKDLGIRKAQGVAGTLQAAIRQADTVTELDQVALAFGDVNLRGKLAVDAEKGLQSAEFDTFALSPGDSARLSLAPSQGGYAITLRGEQLDLKPMLQRFFGLGEGAGGVQSTSVNQALSLDIQLDRALGFYRTTAFDLDLDLSLRGTDIRNARMHALLGNDRSISITTNRTPDGKTLSVAFNDFGTVLRLLGVYPQLEGGEGSLVLQTYNEQKVDVGQFHLNNFAVIDENKVAEILGNHNESRQLIARQNKLSFKSGKVTFIRRSDRIEVTEGVLSGDTVGGTMRGFIYTNDRRYDLVGTYVPLFGLNNVFQKLPLFGPLLGGRNGEGLIGVTFAVRGSLDNPEFKVNPASILAVGAFRSLFEFRAKEQPRAE